MLPAGGIVEARCLLSDRPLAQAEYQRKGSLVLAVSRARLQLQVESMFPRPVSIAEVEKRFARLTRFDRSRERDPMPAWSGRIRSSCASAKSPSTKEAGAIEQVGRHTHLHFPGSPRLRHSFAIHKALITPSMSLTRGGSTSS